MKILIATDGSECSMVAVDKICEFIVSPEDTEIRIVSVYEPQVPIMPEPVAVSGGFYRELDVIAADAAEINTEKAEERLTSRFIDNVPNIEKAIRLGNPAQMIVSEAEHWKPDVIVMGSHGRGFWGKLALGSVSEAVLRHAHCSVLVVRAG